jgi:hypothetical protein
LAAARVDPNPKRIETPVTPARKAAAIPPNKNNNRN